MIRPVVVASLPINGEAQVTLGPPKGVALSCGGANGKPGQQNQTTLPGRRQVVDDGRVGRCGTVNKETCMDRAALGRHAGVRASIVASKPGNAGGAKGRRKMEAL